MTWLAVGGLALSVGSQIIGGSQKASADNINALNQGAQQARSNSIAYEDNAAANKTIADTNLQNQIRTGYRVGILNVQRAQSAKAANQAGINLGKNKLQALGAANANAAAAGSIGSSVDAVTLDIQMQAEQADAGLVEDQRIAQGNFDQGLADTIQAGHDALRSPQHVNVQDVMQPTHVGMDAVIGSALLNTASQYASSTMSLGLGKKTTT